MKLRKIDRAITNSSSFNVKLNSYPFFLKVWHYHTELELVYILKSSGTRFIGNSVNKFDKNELILIGENLPHMWLNDDIYFDTSSKLKAEAIAIHFRKNFLGDKFFEAPEVNHINELIKRSSYGVRFVDFDQKIIKDLKKLLKLNTYEKLIAFLNILNTLAKHSNYELLSSAGYINSINTLENKDLDNIYKYIFNNFKKDIKLKDVANVSNMNPSSFSRFFKKTNRKTFSRYLNEIRVGYACKLLLEDKYSVTAVCYDSGFNNISNFNRQFRIITNMSPSEYLKHHNMID